MLEPTDPTLTPAADPAAEVVPGNQDPADPAAPASESVIPPATDPQNPEPPAADPAKVLENTVPLSRLNEVIEERNALRETTTALTRQVETLTTMVTKAQTGPTTEKQKEVAQDALDGLISAGEITRDEATKLQKIVDAMGYARKSNEEDPRLKALEGTVKQLQQKQYMDQDAIELADTLKKYEGIVDRSKIEGKMKEFAQSGDPDLMRLVKEGSYEDIVRKGFFSEIVQAEAAKLTKGKPPAAPKIEPGKQQPVKTPQTEEVLYDPADPKAYDRALRKAIRTKVREPAE